MQFVSKQVFVCCVGSFKNRFNTHIGSKALNLFHSNGYGQKLDMLKKNNSVCFEFDIDYEFIKSDNICMQFFK